MNTKVGKEVPVNNLCPECGAEIKCECVIGADESVSGNTERLYSCDQCDSAWITTEENGQESCPKRYFFG